MFFEFSVTVPANTPAASFETVECDLAPGTIALVAIQFPRGCVGLVHVQIWRGDHQVWPVNLDGDISSEDQVVSWPEDYDLEDEPLALTLRAWNLDDTFAHTVTVRFALLALATAQSARQSGNVLTRVARAILGTA